MVAVLSAVLAAQAFVVAPASAIDRRPDDAWMTNGKVYATALSENKKILYIGGRFTQVRREPVGTPGETFKVSNVAAIDVERGAPIRSWNPRVAGDGATVYALTRQEGRVFIGGDFAAVGGQPRQNFAAVNATSGEVLPFDPKVGAASDSTSSVQTLIANNSRLYVGGQFSKVDGEARSNLAAFDLERNELAAGWKPSSSHTVKDLEFSALGDTIFAAGAFDDVTGSDGTKQTRQSVARLFTSTGDLHPWKIPDGTIEHPMTAWDLTSRSGRLYGAFGRGRNYAAAFRLDTGNTGSQVWRFGTIGNVHTVALSGDGSRLYFGGHFGIANKRQQVCGNEYLRGLGSLNATTGSIRCDWLPSVNGERPNFIGIRDMAVTGSHLWVGGGFTGISGAKQSNLARFPNR